jgi:hypothetical protein
MGNGSLYQENAMVITLGPELEAALNEQARRKGLSPEVLALNALRERFLVPPPAGESRDEWERRLRQIATDCGVTLPDAALSSEGLYE